MQPVAIFIDLEKKTNVRGQGDCLEAQIPVFKTISQDENKIKTITCTKSYGFENFPAFCLCYLPLDWFGNCGFTLKQKKEFRAFGNDAIIIYNVDEFIRRFEEACDRSNYELAHAFVVYDDFWEQSPHIKEIQKDNPFSSCFIKDSVFMPQNEYRFIICEEKEAFLFDIGDISDISSICRNMWEK